MSVLIIFLSFGIFWLIAIFAKTRTFIALPTQIDKQLHNTKYREIILNLLKSSKLAQIST